MVSRCKSKLHRGDDLLAHYIYRFENPCGHVYKTTAVCTWCHQKMQLRLLRHQRLYCNDCGYQYDCNDSWTFLGEA